VSQELDPNSVRGALRDAVKDAIGFGWTAKRVKKGWRLRSPEGTQWMHLTPATSQPDQQARILRAKVNKALSSEAPSLDTITALEDPNSNLNLECAECGLEFLTATGFQSPRHACWARRGEASADEQEVVEPITPVEVIEPSEGHTDARELDPVESTETPDSSKMSNKEEDIVVENKRAPYRRRKAVQPGLSRALYEAMRSRSQRRDEALSIYANTLAKIMTEAGFEYQEVILSDAEAKIARVFEVLDIDVDMLTKGASLREENEQLRSDLTTLKELLGKY
jgi:hypothetical protein